MLKVYKNPDNPDRLERRGVIRFLEVAGDQEPPDARLTAAERQIVKQLLTLLEPLLSDEGLMFLAGGAEDAALRKRSRDGRSAP